MSVHIDEVNTSVDARGGSASAGDREAGALADLTAEVRLEELRPLVRALVAEEIERWLRGRGVLP